MWPFSRRSDDSPSDDLGKTGEKLAARFLKSRGLKILATNYRCPAGEADIIALDRKGTPDADGKKVPAIVFVEVKTRASDRFTSPESAVDDDKQKHMRAVARYYCATRNTADLGLRFNIVAIVLAPPAEPKINHIVNAF